MVRRSPSAGSRTGWTLVNQPTVRVRSTSGAISSRPWRSTSTSSSPPAARANAASRVSVISAPSSGAVSAVESRTSRRCAPPAVPVRGAPGTRSAPGWRVSTQWVSSPSRSGLCACSVTALA